MLTEKQDAKLSAITTNITNKISVELPEIKLSDSYYDWTYIVRDAKNDKFYIMMKNGQNGTGVFLNGRCLMIAKQGIISDNKSFLNEIINTAKKQGDVIEPVLTQTKKGQLWEPCENCGDTKNPVHLPLHLCDNCWPKN